MDFELTDDQVALRDAARDLLDDLAAPARVRAHVDRDPAPAGGLFDRELWQAMVDQGWLGVDVAEQAGGLGLGTVEVAVLAEQIGGHVAPVPFLPSLLALGAVHGAERADPRGEGPVDLDDAAGRLLAGEAVGCVAWSADARSVRARTSAGGPVVLTGRADPVVGGPAADLAVVLAVEETSDPPGAVPADVPGARPGEAVFLVDLAVTGRPTPEPAMDRTRPLGWLELDEVPAQRLGGERAAAALTDRGATLVAAEMLGAAARVLDLSVEYAKERVQFGRPIGSFQAVKHRCADMLVDVEGMRSTVYWAAWCLGAQDADASVAASTAKTWGSDASRRVMASALQVHGGIGFTWEHDLHLFLKRAQLDRMSFGDAAHHRSRLARMLRPRVEAGHSVV